MEEKTDDEAPTTSSTPSVLEQLLTVFVRPEIERRQSAGELDSPFVLRAAQLICFPDDRPNEVRLNREVSAVLVAKPPQGAAAAVGSTVRLDQVEDLQTIILPESEDPNCGHATLLRLGDRWFVAMDFRYNRAHSDMLLDRAAQFLQVAEHAEQSGGWSAFVYNLFTAMELMAKAELMAMPDPVLKHGKRHNVVRSRLNRWAKLGNVAMEHAQALNELFDLRQDAAYSFLPFEMDPQRAAELRGAAEGLMSHVCANLGLRRPRP